MASVVEYPEVGLPVVCDVWSALSDRRIVTEEEAVTAVIVEEAVDSGLFVEAVETVEVSFVCRKTGQFGPQYPHMSVR